MEPPAAARFLTAQKLLLALAASSPAVAKPLPPFFPVIHNFVTSPPSHEHFFRQLDAITVHPNVSLLATYVPNPTPPDSIPLSHLLNAIVKHAVTSPHAFFSLVYLFEHHTDPDLLGAYQLDSVVALFLRKVAVAFHSLSFESLTHLQSTLTSVYRPSPNLRLHAKLLAQSQPLPDPVFKLLSDTHYKPSALTMLTHLESARRSDFPLALSATHRHFDMHAPNISPHHAALALGILHARFSHKAHASTALRDALRAAQAADDTHCQKVAMQWLASVEPLEQAHLLLHHATDHLALTRHQLLTSSPPSPSELATAGNSVDARLLAAAAWLTRASLPTALCVARAALKRAHRLQNDSYVRAVIAVAEMTALDADLPSGLSMLRRHILRLKHRHTNSTTAPELFMLERSLTMLRFEHTVRAMQLPEACILRDKIKAFAQCAKTNALAFSAQDAELDTMEADVKCFLLAEDSRAAADQALKLAKRAAVYSRPERVVTGLRLRAEAFLSAEEAGGALSDALAAASLAEAMHLDAAHVRSSLTVVETLLRLESPAKQVNATLTPILPRALEGLGSLVRARACQLHAECLMKACAETESVPDKQVVKLVQQALEGI
ncbi:hypothetical protein BWQ96_00382 [Gracilariopsis chorda]|uniref:Anaphase-promoting complex subunit 5 n=1 Tax=Gracilariopsis chorda TaxID=448386 RepID=A0A2V3JAS0_9FLOR|nr:hypothetical protein BWQ96_00382 [Gracilariopsis chorda]|eukprot:PXF49730.1 hypothetical protein BWQ96_00382 [Gracilariopsis chorda]